MKAKKILLADCGLKVENGKLKANGHADINLMKIAKRIEVQVDRFMINERPLLDGKLGVLEYGEYSGVVINGSAIINPVNDEHSLTDTVSSGDLNDIVLRIIGHCAEQNIPLLGICYGHQMIARFAGERVEELPEYEFGFVEIELTDSGRQQSIFAGSSERPFVAEDHGFGLKNAKRTEVLAENETCIQSLTIRGTKIFGIQFHSDYHGDVDGKGTGTLEYYYARDRSFYEDRLSRAPIVKPEDEAEAYKRNCRPLINFMRSCIE